MDWLAHLLTDVSSVPHIILVYSLVIAVGALLGRIRLFGVSLGVTFVLFAAIAAGHFGFTVNPAVLYFLRDFGLTVFIYFIGLQVGPSFFSSFKSGGMVLNLLTVLQVLLGVAVTIALYILFKDTLSLPQMLGVHYGAVTNTPGLGATQETLELFKYTGENIAVAYACAYPLGVIGTIGSAILIRFIFRIKLAEEDKAWDAEERAHHQEPVFFHVEVSNRALEGRTIEQVRNFISRGFIASRILSGSSISSPNGSTVLHMDDCLRIVSQPDVKEAIVAFFGRERTDIDLAEEKSPLVVRTLMVTRESVNGMRIEDLALNRLDGVNITRVFRAGMTLFPSAKLHLQVGDQVYCVGPETAVARMEAKLGNQVKKLDHPNIITIFIGLLLGVIVGSVPFAVPGLPVPLKLGLAWRSAHRRHPARPLRSDHAARHLHDAVSQHDDARDRHLSLPRLRGPCRRRRLRRRHDRRQRAALHGARRPHHRNPASHRGRDRKALPAHQLPQHRGPDGGRHHRSSRPRLRGHALRAQLLGRCLLDRLPARHVPEDPDGAAHPRHPLAVPLKEAKVTLKASRRQTEGRRRKRSDGGLSGVR